MATGYCNLWNTASSYTNVRCDSVGGRAGNFGGTNCADSSILGGPLSNTSPSHTMCAPCSTIVMGNTNTINAISGNAPGGFNSIVNGASNTVSGYYVSILGGSNNAAHSDFSAIASGKFNPIASTGRILRQYYRAIKYSL